MAPSSHHWPHTFFGVLAILWLVFVSRTRGTDLTLVEGTGSAVVHAVITKLHSCNYFENFSDHRLLRRIAYVETKDGTDSSPPGGIWALGEEHFDSISSKMKEVLETCDLGINPSTNELSYRHLNKYPLLSGLAAHLYLYHLQNHVESIPLANNVSKQAEFWYEHYSSNAALKTTVFIQVVNSLNKKEGCKVNADIFFVLDMSHSITESDFRSIRSFMSAFVNETTIGPSATQVGAIVYGNEARVVFNLNKYDNSQDLLKAICKIPYNSSRQGTNTADGLCKLARHGFTAENGSRKASATVYRIAILMSDGESNSKSKECGWNTMQAAAAIHALTPEILVYAIGVSDMVNTHELKAIATHDSYYTYIDNFKNALLHKAQENIEDDICWKATVGYDKGEFIDGTLSENQTVRYEFTLPLLGVTIQVCVRSGQVVVYGSASYPNPNSALNDFHLVLVCEDCQDDSVCKDVFIPPITPKDSTPARSKRSSSNRNHTTIYISVFGMTGESNFVMNSTEGDVTLPTSTGTPTNTPAHSSDSKEKIIIIVAASSGFLLFVIICSLTTYCVCLCAVHRHKKQQKKQKEDEYGLLDVGYVEL